MSTGTCTMARSGCCAWPRPRGSGVRDHELREKHLTEINRFRDV